MHRIIDPRVMYFGTPVVLLSTVNPDGSPNLAPISSAWWLGKSCMLGLDSLSRTTENLLRSGECVINLCDSSMVAAVDALAMLTGTPDVVGHKAEKGFQYEPKKFAASRLTEVPSVSVVPPRVGESLIQLEAILVSSHGFGGPHADARAIEVECITTHIDQRLLDGQRDGHINPLVWDPLLMKFTEYFAHAQNLQPSTLASGFGLDHRL